MKNKNAFTLAETMIVIVVLGIIATLTIPALVNKNKESVAKTKVRKAMAAYESALNKMIIENDLKDNGPLTTWAGAVTNCGNPTQYFKKVQGDGCIFKTSDGVWWNITDIERPLIAFKQDDLTTDKANDQNDYSAFVLVGRFGNDGSLRVDDLAYETANDTDNSKAQVEKLYTLLGMKKASDSGNTPPSPFATCKEQNAEVCSINGVIYKRVSFADTSVTFNGQLYSVSAGNYYVLPLPVETVRCSDCSTTEEYFNFAQNQCKTTGGHLANLAEMKASGESNKDFQWAADESTSSFIIIYRTNMYANDHGDGSYDRVVCIGN